MSGLSEGLFAGEVVHKRLRPCAHELRYRVFAMMFDCARLGELAGRLRLFSYNRFNLFSLYDRDHGDGTPLSSYLAGIAASAGQAAQIERFALLCYPRILGYAFNPLSVFLGLDREERVRLVVYEVNNTFGERMSYVLPAEPDARGTLAQGCAKRLAVSPFNSDRGRYSFRIRADEGVLTLGVALRDDGGPLLKAHFRGRRETLSDGGLLRALRRTGWMTVNVIAGIHLEACKLWLKGLKPVPRQARPLRGPRRGLRRGITYVGTPREGA